MKDPRYSWTQPCCESCWRQRQGDRMPTRLKDPDEEICVYCGAHTLSGIYVREDPKLAKYPTILKEG